jgi:hypothetical protein
VKKIALLSVSLILVLGIVFALAAPVSACIPGKSPGFFKNHPEQWPWVQNSGQLYNPARVGGTTIGQAFDITTGDNYDDMTLMAALWTNGNSDGKAAFWRQAVACLLHQWGDTYEIEFLQALVNDIYPDGGKFINTTGWGNGTYGEDWWTLNDWKTLYFEPLNNQ